MLGSKLFLPGRKRPSPQVSGSLLRHLHPSFQTSPQVKGPPPPFLPVKALPPFPSLRNSVWVKGGVFRLFWLNRIRPSQRPSLPRASRSHPHAQRALGPPEGRGSLAEVRTPFARRLCPTEAPILQTWTPPLGLASQCQLGSRRNQGANSRGEELAWPQGFCSCPLWCLCQSGAGPRCFPPAQLCRWKQERAGAPLAVAQPRRLAGASPHSLQG